MSDCLFKTGLIKINAAQSAMSFAISRTDLNSLLEAFDSFRQSPRLQAFHPEIERVLLFS